MRNYRVNNRIRSDKVRVIDEDGSNLGIRSTKDALVLAEEKGLDLVEISPDAKPPVARIISYDKFRYRKKKEEKKKKQGQKTKEMKTIRITPRAAKNDLDVKAKKAVDFLESGHRVEVMMFLKGREKANKEFGLKKLNDFLEILETPIRIVTEPKYSGRGYITQIVKQ